MSRKDLIIASACEGALILIISLAGWISHRGLIFASLGPTAYELVETPSRPSARPYNVIVGHLIAILAGFAALFLTHARAAPAVSFTFSQVHLQRVRAATLAAMLTVLGTLMARAAQPAAVSTALLISLGTMQTWQGGLLMWAAIVLMAAVGEALRRWRLQHGFDH